jgi:hypothetical protein
VLLEGPAADIASQILATRTGGRCGGRSWSSGRAAYNALTAASTTGATRRKPGWRQVEWQPSRHAAGSHSGMRHSTRVREFSGAR